MAGGRVQSDRHNALHDDRIYILSSVFLTNNTAGLFTYTKMSRLNWNVRQCVPKPGASWAGMPVMHNRCLSFGKSKQPIEMLRRQVAVGG